MVTMFMPLLNEGVDVSRPVEVTPLEGAVYRVEGPMPADEEWEFRPGTLVECKWKKFDDGNHRLIPAGPSPTVRSAFTDYYKRTAGLLAGALPLFAAMEWLPRELNGQPETIPLFLASAGLILVSAVGMIWLKPRSLTGKWALRSGLGFGILFCLGSFVSGI